MSNWPLSNMEADIDERIRGRRVPGTVYASTIAGEAFTVPHDLGVKPSMVMTLPMTNCNVWAEESDERLWDDRKVVLRCNVADAPLRVAVME